MITENTRSRPIIIELLFKTKQSFLSYFAKRVSFLGGLGVLFFFKHLERSRRLLCCCPEPRTSFFAEEDLLQALQRTERLLDVAIVHDIYFERSFFALNFSLFATNKLSAVVMLGLFYRTYPLMRVI